ncbi:hypothetical protein PV416_02335 [Streptomyces ipomoeae]|uniref:hypothetical protein n=1 Tax=Streptomyces ipomoeae TaxID=103232 RepID=UPI0029A27F2D|nr:hypothetical protein [Streptomyces ipomoeae]MDX2819940.1 hypothetical protein [Streptomyces ipomoeae]MDX2872614.1 hypothetical protein [Streptomyces ipomoeae]
MSTAWTLVGGVAALGIAAVLRIAVRVVRQLARKDIRRDLIALSPQQKLAATLVKAGAATFAFAAPGADGRELMIGWLWWRTELDSDGKVRRDMGWALTYRRARRAAGLPVNMRARGVEFVVAPGQTGLTDPVGNDSSTRHS